MDRVAGKCTYSDQVKGCVGGSANPSTMLRMVPLPVPGRI
jgi:hypothetical protein